MKKVVLQKYVVLVLAAVMALCLVACGQGSAAPNPTDGQAEEQTDGQTDGQLEEQPEGQSAPAQDETPAADTAEPSGAEELGGTILLGHYPQDGAQIEWLVLDEQDDKVLLLAQDCIDSLPWHDADEPATWDTCSLRAWLNGNFLTEAFSEEERSGIIVTELSNADDLGYGTSVGQDTRDSIFLLSGAEVERYLPEQDQRTAKPTVYASAQGAYTNESGNCAWWLRSPGMTETSPAYIASAGSVGNRAHEANETIIGVRPAMWVAREFLTSGAASSVSAAAYTDANGDVAYIPAGFVVSEVPGEQTIAGGLVVIAPDSSEYVWVPTGGGAPKSRDFGSYFTAGIVFLAMKMRSMSSTARWCIAS